jgi:hypothetical protein
MIDRPPFYQSTYHDIVSDRMTFYRSHRAEILSTHWRCWTSWIGLAEGDPRPEAIVSGAVAVSAI